MLLSAIIRAVEEREHRGGDVEIADLCYDSRKVASGALFFCIPGLRMDGHDFAAQAVAQGASALVVTHVLDLDVPQVIVGNVREAMALMAAAFYGYPSREMTMAAVTGTNGKTTITYIVRSIAQKAGYTVGLMGTITNLVGERSIPGHLTTPESVDLQRMLREMRDEGVDFVIMEASAHAMTLSRLLGIHFQVVGFTNLTQDHLDFYGAFENYRDAKLMLFDAHWADLAVVNVDDEHALYFQNRIPTVTYGIRENADVYATDIDIHEKGVHFNMTFHKENRKISIQQNLTGLFNVYNSMAAAVMCKQLGISLEDIAQGITAVRSVPGRIEVLDVGMPYTVILDYAHSPDSLSNILKTVRAFTKGRLIALFGAGGDRDREKRPIMGRVGGSLADLSILTSDNPRGEDPLLILQDIEAGITPTGAKYLMMESRREAIEYALRHAEAGDVIVLAGKGHETYQEVRGEKRPFDEKLIVKDLVELIKQERQENA